MQFKSFILEFNLHLRYLHIIKCQVFGEITEKCSVRDGLDDLDLSGIGLLNCYS